LVKLIFGIRNRLIFSKVTVSFCNVQIFVYYMLFLCYFLIFSILPKISFLMIFLQLKKNTQSLVYQGFAYFYN